MADDSVGEVILENRRYRLDRKLAEGGMGAVYQATSFGADGFVKTMAIKTILETYSSNEEFVRMFIGEAKLVADLVHQNIVQVYQLGKVDGVYYIAMEYVDGINLEQYIFRHLDDKLEMPIELGAFLISRVCRGLEYAHKKLGRDGKPLNIVHRDVSPKNIMLTYEGEARLTDFGIAKAQKIMQQEEGEVLMGKVEYMSPEQARYEETDRRSDLFSLGIVMFEVLTGVHIFEVEDIYETLENVKKKRIPDPREIRSEIPEDLARICLKALERDLNRRYQNAGEMGYELEYYMYHDRYGPTIVTLGDYIRKLFHIPDEGTRSWQVDSGSSTDHVQRRADTMYRDPM